MNNMKESMSVMVGVGKGAKSGVLIKDAQSLEGMNAIEILIVYKTGTLTEGKPSVEKVVRANTKYPEDDILQKIISLNSSSEHPLAQATLRYGEEKKIDIKPVSKFEAVTGKGVIGVLDGAALALGNPKLMEQVKATIAPGLEKQAKAEQKLGKTVSFIRRK